MERENRVNARLRQLPAVEKLVEATGPVPDLERWSLIAAARAVLDEARSALLAFEEAGTTDLEELAHRTLRLAQDLEQPFPRRVLNATGVVVHTNLGRAPLAPEAAAAVAHVAAGYSDLEFDLEKGERGSRLTRIARRLCLLSGAEAALVVNNNAAGVLLALDTLAAGREVVLSRGELVEIGGSFRVPEIMASSRARLLEIGTTNRTHLADYEGAVGPETGMLLKVHPSNFEIRGFTAQVEIRDLAPVARAAGIPLVEDRGSGTFVDLRPHGIPEPVAWQGLDDGADLVLFSGDKLLGGPQGGIVLGRADLVAKMRKSPLARALRVDKMTLAALDWTTRVMLEGRAFESIPVLRMLTTPVDRLRHKAERLASALAAKGFKTSVEPHSGRVGGGSLPEVELQGVVVRVDPSGSASGLARSLREGEPPLLVRVQEDAVLLDPRTLEEGDLETAAAAFGALV